MREDWVECTIKDISKIINGDRGKNYPSRQHYISHGLPFVSAGNINDNNKLEKSSLNFISQERFNLLKGGFLKQGDILFCIRGSLGKLAIYDLDIDGAIASSLVIVRRITSVEEKYLLYYLSSFNIKLFINEFNNGTAQPNLSAKDFSNFQFPLPPLPEQRTIVKKLESLFSSLDAGVADLKKAQQQLKTYRQAVLKKAFGGELNKQLLGKVSLVKRGKSKHRPRNDERLFGGNYPFIQTGEIRKANGGIVKEYENTYSEFGLAQSKLWPKGTLCLTIAANIGETAFLGFDACFPDSVVGITSDESVLNLNYLNYYIQLTKQEIDKVASATAQKNINVDFLENLEIPVPTIKWQLQILREIESRLSVCDSIEQNIKESLSKAEALRQSILKKAFEGNLLTAQELTASKMAADYEPASVLLERIKTEQSTVVKKPSKIIIKKKTKAKDKQTI